VKLHLIHIFIYAFSEALELGEMMEGTFNRPPPPFTIKNANLFKKLYFLIVLFLIFRYNCIFYCKGDGGRLKVPLYHFSRVRASIFCEIYSLLILMKFCFFLGWKYSLLNLSFVSNWVGILVL
jgi:hypothetical protein